MVYYYSSRLITMPWPFTILSFITYSLFCNCLHIEQQTVITQEITYFFRNVVGIKINFRVRFSCVSIRHGLFIRNIKSFSWKPCSFRRFPFRLNINCDFIYSWQEVDPRRPRTRDMTFACKCIDELLIVFYSIFIYFFVNFLNCNRWLCESRFY